MILLSKDQILRAYNKLMKKFGGLSGLRNMNSLDYSIESINAKIFGEELYPTLEEKAGLLCFNLVKNHPFIDGNKRIGYFCLKTTLKLNGYDLSFSKKDIIAIILKLASNELNYSEFIALIKDNLKNSYITKQ